MHRCMGNAIRLACAPRHMSFFEGYMSYWPPGGLGNINPGPRAGHGQDAVEPTSERGARVS